MLSDAKLSLYANTYLDSTRQPGDSKGSTLNHKELCIHAHFYQPPREDPFTGVIAPELGAEPYSNFNEKVTAECYRPNAELGNFELISFNLGPTLASWLESYDPVTYQRILDSDRKNVMRYGVGNAIAQAYNHTILPLATRRDTAVIRRGCGCRRWR